MFGQQKRTYLVYSRGLLPHDLKLGSLYLDPVNPLEGEYKRFESLVNENHLHDWTGPAEIDSSIELTFTASRQWLINSGIFSILKGELGRGKSHEVKIRGKSGRRLQIKRPETFLNDVILKSEPAKAWLAKNLSISRHLYYLSKSTFGVAKLPHIWLVTGIQYINGAEIVATRAQSKKLVASVNTPIPEPVAAAAMVLWGQEGVASGIENSSIDQNMMSYHHEDERVWAAQFTQLSVQFSPEPVSAGDLPMRVPLNDLVDIQSGGIRKGARPAGPSLSGESAEISLLAGDGAALPHGEDLVNLMQDVDWSSVDRLLDKSYQLHEETMDGHSETK